MIAFDIGDLQIPSVSWTPDSRILASSAETVWAERTITEAAALSIVIRIRGNYRNLCDLFPRLPLP
jgi:hypothetical protein